ncbi:MAG: hypothetical protein M5R36_19800 [Deltaproteobacteria bacterium]|nr:hypothetical protein [Deltaproteobacteria bacterium]
MLNILLTIAYLSVVAGAVSGVVLLWKPDHRLLDMIHKKSGPFTFFVYGVYYVLFQFYESGPYQRAMLAVLFLFIAYGGLTPVPARADTKSPALHIAVGVGALLVFSFVYFTLILHWTGLGAAIQEMVG